MTAQLIQRPVACPGCLAVPQDLPEPAGRAGEIVLSLPTIHCQSCISEVERVLRAAPGVRDARVNLTLRRAMVAAAPGVTAGDLAGLLERSGYEAHELDPGALSQTRAGAAGRDLLMRLAVAGFASMNVMLLSVAVWSGAADATRDMFHWISAAITLPAIAFSAQPFFRSGWGALRAGRLNMDVPISLALLLALATSLWETWLSGEHAYFDAALTLTFFLLAGRWLEARSRAAARSAAEELTALEVPRAWRMEEGQAVEVAVAALRPGDIVQVRPGGRMPVDGTVVTGESEVDRSFLTGESVPVQAGPGDAVQAGAVNLTGPLQVRATAVGQDTSLQQIARLVAVAESGRARYTPLADRAARLYAPGVHILSALAFAGWLAWAGDLRVALNIAAAVLIITCPCALGLAVPAVTTAASGRLFRRGLLIKDATALERLAEVDSVVFDKTGTLTVGVPRLLGWDGLAPETQSLARALAAGSAHPLAQAIVSAATQTSTPALPLTDLREQPGHGVSARWQGRAVKLGRPDWIGVAAGGSGLCTALDDGTGAPLLLRFEDGLRPGAEAALRGLQAAGVSVSLLSGDRIDAVEAMAARLGIADWQAGMLPQDKAARIAEMTAQGRKVLMVGDGLNDVAALAAAHVSISPARALDAARVASDIVLLGENLGPVAGALTTARRARRRIAENFRIATAYNVIAVPLAVAGFATPLIAALAMSASSITVSLNALRLGRAE